jgi:WhiB family redox-sensing transcriptional regulator
MFFGLEGEGRRARKHRERMAKALCDRCEVIVQCREHALTVGEPYGIWGGLSVAERQTLAGRDPFGARPHDGSGPSR